MFGLGLGLGLFGPLNAASGPVPPGTFTYRRPGGVFLFIRPTGPLDTYLRP
jgi:hypothetical protein